MDDHWRLLILIAEVIEVDGKNVANVEKIAVSIHRDKITEDELTYFNEEPKLAELVLSNENQRIVSIEELSGCIKV